jgi:hypothetical protein
LKKAAPLASDVGAERRLNGRSETRYLDIPHVSFKLFLNIVFYFLHSSSSISSKTALPYRCQNFWNKKGAVFISQKPPAELKLALDVLSGVFSGGVFYLLDDVFKIPIAAYHVSSN